MNGSSIWAIVALGFATAITIFTLFTEKNERERIPSRWRRRRTPILCILTLVALLVGAIQIFKADRESHDAAEDARRANKALNEAVAHLNESTTKIAEMTALNNQLQNRLVKQSDTITELSKENIAAVTGGNSFCYVIASPVENNFVLSAATVGSSPLHEVGIEMVDVDLLRTLTQKPNLTMQEIQSFTTVFPFIPFLASSSSRMFGTIPMNGREKRNLHFNFFSMNGVWGEDLNLRFVKGQWQQALRVMKELKNNKRKMIYSVVPPDYPKVNGEVDW